MRSSVRALLTAVALVMPPAGHPAVADDANFEFSKTANPIGPWSYGWAASPGAAFQAFTTETNLTNGLARWSAPNGASLSLGCNQSVNEPGVTMLAGDLSARLGTGGAATALRWTAQSNGTWHARATFVSEAGYFPPSAVGILTGSSNEQLGVTMAAGDVNGDGYADLLVGEPQWSNGQSGEGRVSLYLGGPGGPVASPAWSYESNTANAQAGASVAIGDFNGDGFMDIAFSAPGTIQGHVYLYKGTPTGPVLLLTYTTGTNFGKSICFGDFNGDGLKDLAVFQPDVVWVWNGTTGTVGGPNYSFNCLTNQPAQTIACAGDVNGDGIEDLIAGAPGSNSGTGQVRIALGAPGGIPNTPAGVLIPGDASGIQFGAAVAAAGDVDGDGYGDFLVGSTMRQAGGQAVGGIQVFRGGPSGPSTTASWSAVGTVMNDRFGFAACSVGDVNNDGHDDFVVGAPFYSNGQAIEGAGFLFYGGPVGTLTLHATYEMNSSPAELGSSMAPGDLNGDGLMDVALGAPGFTINSNNYGRVMSEMALGPATVPFARTSVRLLADGVTVAQDSLNTATGRDTVTLEATISANAGHTLDAEVSDVGGTLKYEAVGMDVAIEPDVAPSNPLGPVLVLGNQRFVPIQGPPAFEAAAFDPAARYLASNGKLVDVCGGFHSAGPDGPGIAWDSVTRKFWNISFDAGNQRWVVAAWDTTTQTATTVFTIPRVLTVPGTGADTLEDARGLAVDSSFVYVVDAGPAGLVPPANGWFKFTRAGVPVASIKGGAFAANATYDIVDDMVYSPFASPTEPGRLLVAIEHVGILVLDTNGALRDSSTWRGQNLARASAPSAFAGLALDPVTGDLFLADNDRSIAQRWMRLTNSGPTTYLIGDGSPGVLIAPFAECGSVDPLLWDPIVPKTTYCPPGFLLFGVAYRTLDRRVYAVDYATGTLWKFDPRGGRGVRVGETGIQSMWGLAYDPGRDRLYGLQNTTGSQVWSIQPRTAVATALPQVTPYPMTDIGFEPNGAAIYGVTGGSSPQLVRIDRDTGAGTIVGPTHYVSGLDWDPVRGALVGMTSSDSLWSINVGTGAASLIAKVSSSSGWEGLAVATVPAAGTVDVPPVIGSPGVALALAVAPQPSREGAALTFALSEVAPVQIDLYDVAGRHVRRVADARFVVGPHTITWDGRDDEGRSAAAGIYFARLSAGGRSVTARIVRVR